MDGKRFRPHLTVARCGRPTEVTAWVRLLDGYRGPAWQADRLTLVASHLGEGPRRRPRYAGPSFNRMVPNILTLLGLCAGLTSMRYALDGRFGSAGAALNDGARRARNGVVVFVHQDVYLHSLVALEEAAAALIKPTMSDEEKKAARDARYAARKANKQKKRK